MKNKKQVKLDLNLLQFLVKKQKNRKIILNTVRGKFDTSEKKLHRAAELLRGRTIKDALLQIFIQPYSKSLFYLQKLLKSLSANLVNQYTKKNVNIDINNLKFNINIGRGRLEKRLNPRARGRCDITTLNTSVCTISAFEELSKILPFDLAASGVTNG